MALALALCAGCAAEPPPVAHAMRPIPEGRARDLIARTFRGAGFPSELDRTVNVGPAEQPVRLDVAAAGHKFGVAYLTAQDWSTAGGALPPRRTDGSLVVATAEGGTKVLCLFADDYTEDDASGEQHTRTTDAADRRLERDVRDFLHHAQEQSWP